MTWGLASLLWLVPCQALALDPIDCALAQVGTPTAPLLVIVDASSVANPFGCYLTEMLRGEGLLEFQVVDLAVLEGDPGAASLLAAFDVVLLGEAVLDASFEQLLRDYVAGGGALVAMRPDADLDDLFGLSFQAERPEQVLQFYSVASDPELPGHGITPESIQYHGAADEYAMVGAEALAWLHDDLTTASAHPAATLFANGAGRAAAFTFDLAKSIVLTRQGNPAWAGMDNDGFTGYRTIDLFWGPGPVSWFSTERLRVPQADEAQRLLAHLVADLVPRPLPRVAYLPAARRTLIVSTGDSEDSPGSELEATMNAVASRGGFYTHYLRPASIDSTSVPQEASWRAAGHETGVHMGFGGGLKTYPVLEAAYADVTQMLEAKFGHPSRTCRNHTIEWVGWTEMAEIEAQYGTELDTNYYHYLEPLDGLQNGYVTGGASTQRIADENGTLLGIYQAATQWADEFFDMKGLTALQTYAETRGMIDAAEALDYPSAFVANVHQPNYNKHPAHIAQAWAHRLWDLAEERQIPLWSAEMLLDFTLARAGAQVDDASWDGSTLDFDFVNPDPGQPLSVLVPLQFGGEGLAALRVNGTPSAFSTVLLKGRAYATIDASGASTSVSADFEPGVQQLLTTQTADFESGTQNGVEVVGFEGGALQLAALGGTQLFDDFDDPTALDPATWEVVSLLGNPVDVDLAGGTAKLLGGTGARSVGAWQAHAIAGLVTLDPGGNAHFGFATALDPSEGEPLLEWMIFTAKPGELQARTRAGGSEQNEVIAGMIPGVPYRLEILWNGDDSVEFHLDGALVAVHDRSFSGPMHAYLSSNVNQLGEADWIRVTGGSGFEPAGSFESGALDGGELRRFGAFAWEGDAPAGTTLSFETSTSSDGSSWSGWVAVGPSGQIASPAGRFIRFRVVMSTSSPSVSPVVASVSITSTPLPSTPLPGLRSLALLLLVPALSIAARCLRPRRQVARGSQ